MAYDGRRFQEVWMTVAFDALTRHGSPLREHFADPGVTAIYLNADGGLWTTSQGVGRRRVGEMSESAVLGFLHAVASLAGVSFTAGEPSLAANLPQGEPFLGSRVQGFRPPTTPAATFVVRKPSSRLLTLDD